MRWTNANGEGVPATSKMRVVTRRSSTQAPIRASGAPMIAPMGLPHQI
jgi:hypothetical protein